MSDLKSTNNKTSYFTGVQRSRLESSEGLVPGVCKTQCTNRNSFNVLSNNFSSENIGAQKIVCDTTIYKTGNNSQYALDDLIQSHISSFSEISCERDNSVKFPNSDHINVRADETGEFHKNCVNTCSVMDCSIPLRYTDDSAVGCSYSKEDIQLPVFAHLSQRRSVGLRKSKSLDREEKVEKTSGEASLPSTLIAGSSNGNQGSDSAKVRAKLHSFWNNMIYGWKMKREVNLKVDSATWLLGKFYHNKTNDSSQDVAKELRRDFLSKIWFSYRVNFPAIPGTDLVSDTGWGCMLRCGQMMMAQALVCHFLDRAWRIPADLTVHKNDLHTMILRWFGDSASNTSPFSLHQLVSMGENYGRKAGDWYGPTHAAQVLRDALNVSKATHNLLRSICMHVALDGIVFKQDVMDLCLESPKANFSNSSPMKHDVNISNDTLATLNVSYQEEQLHTQNETVLKAMQEQDLHESSDISYSSFTDSCPSYSEFGFPNVSTVQPHWRSLILFVSVRLGNDKMNPFYIPCLKSLLAYEHCIGIIGGRPKHALFFIGWQGDHLIHMDPHSCQPAVDVDKENFNEKSFHSSSMRTISFSEMDPSCAIGFYFRRKEEYQNFIDKFSEIISPVKRNLDYPVFALADGKRIDLEDIALPHLYQRHFSHSESEGCNDEDDYILL